MSPSPRPAPTYHALPIASLTPGPLLAQLTCRIANVHLHPVTSSADSAAKFVAHLVLQDPSGALLTKLYFAAAPPLLTLGAPCILRTPHLSPHPASAHIALCTSVFPERDALSGFTLLTPVPGSNKMPLPPSLMTLAAFLALAPDVPCAGSILVCVRSVGPLKTLEGKHGQVYEKTEVRVADVSGETKLALWGAVGASARAWVVDHTVLGILAPVLERGGGGVGLGMESVVTVDPAGEGEEEVGTLREWAKAERLRRGVNPVVPARWLNVKEGRDRILFSLGELDDFARSFPEAFLTGYLSLIILDVSLCALSHRVQLCAAECCGIPLYANAVQSTCLTCLRRVVLHPNPKLVIARLIDETGCIGGGEMLWGRGVLGKVLGCSAAELVEMGEEELERSEARLLFCRVELRVAWCREGGRVVVLDVGDKRGGVGRIESKGLSELFL